MSAFIIGLTGGVASGKSTVEALFQARGIAVSDADQAARAAVAVGSAGLAEVVAQFGTEVLDAAGQLDRAAMRRRIFSDPQARQQLEAILHPRVRASLQLACQAAKGPYAIASIPLLTESGGRSAYPWLARILMVDVPETVQQVRLLARDGVDAALARAMIDAQATRQQRLALADDVIGNTGPVDALAAQVAALDGLYRRLASA